MTVIVRVLRGLIVTLVMIGAFGLGIGATSAPVGAQGWWTGSGMAGAGC